MLNAFVKNILFIATCVFCTVENGQAADWPMWRGDAGRTAATAGQLPDELNLSWTIQLPQLEPAWPNQPLLQFDVGYQPVVAGGIMFVASSANDSVTAYELKTGKQQWQFFAEGPIRFAPAASDGKVYFNCDDGHLYCLQASNGKLLWKFRGAPTDRKIIGNKRLISAWPARGAAVVKEGKVYFAASIWPFMGTFVYAIEADTGKLIWKNSGTGSLYLMQPHDSSAFGGVTPQGYLAISGESLIVPNGRSAPACFDAVSGQFKYFHLGENKRRGSYAVAANQNYFFNTRTVYDTATGNSSFSLPTSNLPILTEQTLYCGGSSLNAYDLKSPATKTEKDRKGRKTSRLSLNRKWEKDAAFRLWLKAGNRLYGSQKGKIAAFELDAQTEKPSLAWQKDLSGEVSSMIAADGCLVISTVEGNLYCFSGETISQPVTHKKTIAKSSSAQKVDQESVQRLIKQFNITQGYCLAFGLKDGHQLAELARQTKLQIIGVDADAKKVSQIRNHLDALSLYGKRISICVADPVPLDVSPYLASLIISENIDDSGIDQGVPFVRRIFQALRPYGGVAVFNTSDEQHDQFNVAVIEAKLKKAEVLRSGKMTILKRVGALPGSGDWTHQYADVANTAVSKDSLVKAPLGILWFGGSTNENILPRHGHGPSEQVIGGRLFIEGVDSMRAMDVYTGRILWETKLPGIGKYYSNTSHQPGANSVGSNYASAKDGIYIAYGNKGLRLDPQTGKILAEFKLPADENSKAPEWGYIGLWENLLIVGSSPIKEEGKTPGKFTQDGTTSKRLVVMDRYSGKVLWKKEAELGFRHNAIVLGDGKLFCIDRLPDSVVEIMKRRGLKIKGTDRLLALDAVSGKEIWSSGKNIFGTWLAYSTEFGILLQSGRAARDMLRDEPANRMIAYRGDAGDVVWDKPNSHSGPCLLHHQRIITQSGAFDLLSGEKELRTNPLNGVKSSWNYSRNYGCNSAVGSECLLTFRSAAAGYFDLLSDSGTGNMGGFKSGCTSNLIVANGVLNAPDYTRTCSCAYQNQTSLAFIHMPEMEQWTFNTFRINKERIRKLGINLGAPGDRKSDAGTLWLEYPYVGGPSPKVPVEILPKNAKWFRFHTSEMKSGKNKWIAASGVEGIESIKITLDPLAKQTRKYTVRLHFTEPDYDIAAQRKFSVSIQNEMKIPELDIAASTGGSHRGIVKTFSGIDVKNDLVVQFKRNSGIKSAGAVLCGIEVIEEGH